MARRHWAELPRWQRIGTLVLAPVEAILTATAAADLMLGAVRKVMAEGKTLTSDLGGKASTQEMGDAIAAAV